jgi:cation transport ATPase
VAEPERRVKEELDQEWSELVEELRLAMPGVQVLFAFLLILPFQRPFDELSREQEYVYFSALLAAAIAVVLLISPAANHRLRWRQGDKDALMRTATRSAVAATVFIALAMTASVFLITDVLFGLPLTAIVPSALAALFAWFWYGLPLWRRARERRD